MYFVTVVNQKPYRSRCWGYYADESRAEQAVRENWTDMYEHGYYDLAVIEEILEGVCALPEKARWFSVEMKDGDVYLVTELATPPDQFEYTCSFAIG